MTDPRPLITQQFYTSLIALLDYAIDLGVSVTLLLASYRVNSWCLWGIGLAAFVVTVGAKNVAAWKQNEAEKVQTNGQTV